jgi:CubicO group peptidase (beta-lactamase class C family)
MHTPGLCMMIIEGDEITFSQGFGVKDLSTGAKVDPESLFVVASTTKAFTATALGILADEGLFQWETPLREYLPELRLMDLFIERNITAIDLLSHRTGYPRHDKVWFGAAKNRQEVIDALPFLEPNCGFRSVWQYNNMMYVLAGHLVEAITGSTWEDYLTERILRPLGMNRSNFSIDEMEAMGNAAKGYAWKGDRYEAIPLRRAEHIGPAGSLNTCGNDMARWIRLQMCNGRGNNQQIVSQETLNRIHRPIMVAPSFLPGSYAEILHTQYGLGWFSEVYRGNRIVYHVGNLDGFYALVSFMPEHRFGHVILSNMTPNRAPYVLSYNLYDRFLKSPATDWNQKIRENVQQLEESELRIREKKMKERISGTDPSFPMSEYTGLYCHPAYGEVLVHVQDNQLHITFGEFSARLTHYHYDMYVCDGSEKGFPGITIASFFADAKGQVCRVTIPFEPAVGAAEIVFSKMVAQQV